MGMKGFKNVDLVELFGIVLPLLFILLIGGYHNCIYGDNYKIVWIMGHHLLFISMSILIIILSYSDKMKLIFKYVMLPYFIFKFIYQLICYYKLYIVNPDTWEFIWNAVLALVLLIGLIITVIKK